MSQSHKPSQWPYWFLAVTFGSLFLVGTYFVVQDMIIRRMPGEDWIILLFLVAIFAAPVSIGIIRIRQIQKGIDPKVADALLGSEQPGRSLTPWAAYVLRGFFILSLLGFAAWSGSQTFELQKVGVTGPGIVIGRSHSSGYRSSHDNTIVRFQTQRRALVTAVCPDGTNIFKPELGARVTVIYDPNDVSNVMIDQFFEKWSGTLFYLVLVLVISSGSILRYWFGRTPDRGKPGKSFWEQPSP